MLIALLILMLFGSDGPEAMFGIPDLEERIITTIPDLKKQGEVLAIVAQAKREVATAQEKLGDQGELLKRQQGEKIVTSGELQSSFEELYLIRQEFQYSMVDRDTELREALTDAEFKAIVIDGLAASMPSPEMAEEKAEDVGDRLGLVLEEIRTVIEKHIEGAEQRQQGLAAFQAFDTYMNALVEQDTAHASMVDIYHQREVSRVVLEDTYTDMDRFRVDMFDHFIDMREVLIEVTTEDEWRPIATKLNVIFR